MKTIIFNQVLAAVETVTEIPRDLIQSRSKRPDVAEARSLLFYFLYKKGFRRSEIARITGLTRQCIATHITQFDDRKDVKGSMLSICCQNISNMLSAK